MKEGHKMAKIPWVVWGTIKSSEYKIAINISRNYPCYLAPYKSEIFFFKKCQLLIDPQTDTENLLEINFIFIGPFHCRANMTSGACPWNE